MTRLWRFRFVFMLILGLTLILSAEGWSYRGLIEQVVPDQDGASL
jgi:hypothetical protein